MKFEPLFMVLEKNEVPVKMKVITCEYWLIKSGINVILTSLLMFLWPSKIFWFPLKLRIN